MSGTKWSQKQEHFDWMQKCLVCWKMCEEFIVWSLENGKHISLINACRDATEMCSQCIKFEAQRSPFFEQLCDVCADICEKFAFGLQSLESTDEIIIETISSCKIFAEASRKISGREGNDTSNSNNGFIGKRERKM